MITVSLFGGLGNQMFQYAAGKALAEHHGVALAFDVSGFRGDRQRSFLLDRLRVPDSAVLPVAAGNFARNKWKGRIDRMLAKAGLPKLLSPPNEYREPHFHYDPSFATLGPQTSLFGYFQSERYFGSIAGSLREWFAPREPLGDAAAAVLTRIEASRMPISVHVRRGDYLNPGTIEAHGLLGETYYRSALAGLESRVGGEGKLFVFSDDAAAAERLVDFAPRSRLEHVRGDPARPWEDIALMARCRHHVIANSSFSWWGAWLNPSIEKVVAAPRAWFAPTVLKKTDMADLYPRGWMLV